MKKKEIVLLGGGGHSKVVRDAIRELTVLKVISKGAEETKVLEEFYRFGCRLAHVAVGSVGDAALRVKLAQKLKALGFELPAIIHPAAIVADGVAVGEGTFIAAGAVIGPGAVIGRGVIINTRAAVDHDCRIGDFTHIAPGATLSGGVEVVEKAHIGCGSTVIEYKKIGSKTMIGAGSVVVSDIPSNSKAFGNPCRVKT